jgi:hypothetical protein
MALQASRSSSDFVLVRYVLCERVGSVCLRELKDS